MPLRLSLRLLLLALASVLWLAPRTEAQLVDGLERMPLQWQLAENDCQAQVVQHQIDAVGGHDDRPCEAITVSAGHGTRLLLEYRITPARVIDELQSSLWVRSAQAGVRIAMRVRYPYVHDPQTGRTVSAIVFGDKHRKPGQWDRLRIDHLPGRLRGKEAALRVEFGADVDLRGAFVDAVLVDVYNQPGVMTIRLDDLTVDRMVPVGSVGLAARPSFGGGGGETAADAAMRPVQTPLFGAQQTTRIVEYNGEPLSYLRTLGFDAVLLTKPLTDEILRAANRAQMRIYAPPPTAVNPAWEPLLEPLAGWYLGTSQDSSQINTVKREAARIAAFPPRWQRAAVVAPAEDWAQYAAFLPALVYDLPPTTLGLLPAEEHAYLSDIRARTQRSAQMIVGVQTAPPAALVQQLDAYSNHIGALPVEDYGWHPLWLQTMRALQACPRAILFRSTRSLASGTAVDQKRALALGFVNRCIEAVGPLLVRATPAGTLPCEGASYAAHRLSLGPTDLVIATTETAGPVDILAGDGDVLQIQFPPQLANRFAWRLTGMTSERLDFQNTPLGPALEIVSPDAAELILVSQDPTLGHRVSTLLSQLAQPAALDRWQLTSESVFQTRADWDSMVAARVARPQAMPMDLMTAAANTLVEGEPLYRGGDGPATLRLARRADAWMLRSRSQMLPSLLPRSDVRYSFPALLAPGGVSLQVALTPQILSGSWSRNLLPIGAFRDAESLQHSGWTHDKRIESTSRSAVNIVATGPQDDARLLRVEVISTNDVPLPGGYAGTAVRIRSPAVGCPPDRLIRISARVRTLGFGAAYQGVLVYDSLGGAELGVLVRSSDDWQRVELYRHTLGTAPLQVMFEVIGAGEAMIDNVTVQMWDAQPQDPKRLRPISP